MKKAVSPQQQRAALIARAIKGVKGEQWRALPAEDRREAILAARRVVRVLDRIDGGSAHETEEHDDE
jgi:hypothetical protein